MTLDPSPAFLSDLLASALEVTEADFGNIQLFDRATGRFEIVAQIGLSRSFVDFFDAVGAGEATSGAALQRGARVCVTDVERDPIFAGTPALEVLREAGIRAVQSTPLLGTAGECLGMFSTHYRAPVRFDDRMSHAFDLVARQASSEIGRRRAEAAHARSEARCRALIENISVITWSCPASGLHVEPQPAWMAFTGQTAEEMLGAGWTGAIHPDDSATVLERWTDAVASCLPFSSEHRIRRHDGVWRWMKVSGVPLRDGTGQVTEWFWICVDLTEQRIAEEGRKDLSRLVERGSQFVGICDPDFGITYVNRSALRLLGVETLDQVRGRHILELIHPDDRDRWGQAAFSSMRAGKAIELEVQYRSFQTGSPVWVRQSVEALMDERGKLSGYSIFATDVSESRQARDQLSESEMRFHGLFDTAGVGVTLTDAGMRFVATNQRYAEITGFSREELLRMGPVDLSLPENRERERTLMWDTISSNQLIRNFERPIRRKDGSIAWVRFNASPVRNGAGRLQGIVAVTDEITEERMSAQALKEREAWITSIFENVPVGLAIFDATGKSILSNREARRLVPDGLVSERDDRQKRRWRAYRPDGSMLPAEEYPVSRALRGESHDGAVELQHVADDGTVSWHIIRAVTLRDPAGQVSAVLAVADDITERKRAADRLYQARKMEAIGQLASGIVHDSNNLLRAVLLNLDLASRYVHEPEAVTLLQRAIAALKAGSQQNAKIMAVGRMPNLLPARLNLNDCVRDTLDLLEKSLGDGIAVRTSFEADPWPVEADEGEVGNALMNLVINARDALPKGGTLTVATENVTLGMEEAFSLGVGPGEYVRLMVQDTGTGMTPETLHRCTEPFFTTKQPGQGNGLGLSSLYGFARHARMGLEISSTLGLGTTVRLFFPRSSGSTKPKVNRESIDRVGAGRRILVVEDNGALRRMVTQSLEMLGYEVIEAGTVQEAMETLCADRQIDLVFSDITMPGGQSGHDLVDWMKKNRPGLRFLLTSGTDPAAGEQRRGGDDIEILAKPYTMARLAEEIGKALNGPAKP